ncbi:hypothetical protein H744_1c0191 [Photobacterium gaetbulicola Gung47]|uniref:Uncharacterized protein n=1 Tax=Photobacterium gaetbulicola Gung47 TaxID=658445 RepID=A0A0C5WG95_9GAMM|nr:hypothetical protein H744_1c0191 [Photobacterium gaetbulicola Gung47]
MEALNNGLRRPIQPYRFEKHPKPQNHLKSFKISKLKSKTLNANRVAQPLATPIDRMDTSLVESFRQSSILKNETQCPFSHQVVGWICTWWNNRIEDAHAEQVQHAQSLLADSQQA